MVYEYVPPPVHPTNTTPKQPKGLALASLIVGIASLIFCWVPVLGALGGVVAVVLAIIALIKAQPKGMSIAGLVTGIVAFIAGIALTLTAFVFLGTLGSEVLATGPLAESAPPAETPSEEPAPEESSGSDKSTDEILAYFCDNYDACYSLDVPNPEYTPEYCTHIRYYFGEDPSGEDQLQKASALGSTNDRNAPLWRLAAGALADDTKLTEEEFEDLGTVITQFYFEGYYECNFQD